MPGPDLRSFTVTSSIRGRTLGALIKDDITLEVRCQNLPRCGQIVVWPALWMSRQRQFKRHLNKPIEDVARQMRCSICKTQRLLIAKNRPWQLGDHMREKPPPE